MLENFLGCEDTPIAVGPWGGQYGFHWDDGVYSGVRLIVLNHGQGIDSIQIEYDKQGNPVWSERHGGNGGYKTDKVKLDYPEEFLSSIHGYYGNLYDGGPVRVRSLTFVSNERIYGPFGIEQGTYFSFPMVGHKIVGFYGRCSWYLDAIGAYLKPLHNDTPSRSIAYAQNYVAGGAENFGYSFVQRSIEYNYDLVFAINQMDNHTNTSPITFSRQSNHTNTSPITFSRQSNHTSASPVTFSRQSNHTNASPVTFSRQSNHINTSPITFSRQSSSSESSDEGKKEKILALPSTKEEISPDSEGPVTYGPWGGSGGSVFDDGVYTGIRQINLSRNLGIVWIKVLYEQNGLPVWGSRNGGTGGFKKEKIIFDYPFEVLTHITGFHGPAMLYGPNIIRSLTFHTTKRKYGPYGEEQGVPFSTNLNEGMIIGFHGRKGLFVDAIGVHVLEGKVTPPAHPPSTSHNNFDATATDGEKPLWPSKQVVNRAQFEEIPYGVVKEPAPCGPGPWGGEGGKPWDDGVYTGIRQIFVTRSEVICSIQVEYDRNGQSVWSVKHGGNSGINTHRIKLECPHEVLTCMSGYYGPTSRANHTKVLRSLTFYTTRGRFGPFGEETGTFFTSMKTEGKVVGFHGRSGMYVDAVGVHMQHWLGGPKRPKTSFFRMFA